MSFAHASLNCIVHQVYIVLAWCAFNGAFLAKVASGEVFGELCCIECLFVTWMSIVFTRKDVERT